MIPLPLLLFLLPAADKAPAPPPAAIDGLPIGGLPKQELPQRGCAAYLFSTGATRTLAVMAQADPALLRVSIDGAVIDLARSTEGPMTGFGFANSTQYRRDDITATLDMTVTTRGDLTNGAIVSAATLRVDRPGRDSIVLPVAGLIGCAA